jgi:hypothetical protein
MLAYINASGNANKRAIDNEFDNDLSNNDLKKIEQKDKSHRQAILKLRTIVEKKLPSLSRRLKAIKKKSTTHTPVIKNENLALAINPIKKPKIHPSIPQVSKEEQSILNQQEKAIQSIENLMNHILSNNRYKPKRK